MRRRPVRLVSRTLLALVTAVIPYEERLDVKGCERYRGEGTLGLSLWPSGRFELSTEVGVLAGSIRSGPRSRVLHLVFDDASLTFLAEYLRAGANAVCEMPMALSEGEVRTARLRLQSRQGVSQVQLDLVTQGGATAPEGEVRFRHRLRGRGEFQVMPGREAPPRRAGGVILRSPSPV